MKLIRFPNYRAYVDAQVEANQRKLRRIWVQADTIAFIAAHVPARRILCHGTRNGAELELFAGFYPEILGTVILGTEISPTAVRFPRTVQHDFHIPLPGWHGNADLVYSNSLDHAYDPKRAVRTWAAQLAPRGMLALEVVWNRRPKPSDPCKLDPPDIGPLLRRAGLALITEWPGRPDATLFLCRAAAASCTLSSRSPQGDPS